MPPAYFADHDRDTQMAHLRAIAAARASGLPLRITLRNEEGTSWTFINEKDYPGFLAENLRNIPDNAPLRVAKVHASRDGSLVLDTLILGDTPRFDAHDPAQAAKLAEILAYADAQGHAAEREAIARHLAGTSAEYVRAVTPERARVTWERFHQVSGTDDTHVVVEPEDDLKLSRVVIMVGNTTPRRFFYRAASLFGRRGVDIRRAYLDVFEDGHNGFVSMLTFLVLAPEGGPIDPQSAFWQSLKTELSRLKWLTEAAFELHGKERHLGVVNAEVVMALASLTHQVLSRESAYAYAKDRVSAIAARHASLSGTIAELFRERFHPERPLDEHAFEARAVMVLDSIERSVEADDARRVLTSMLSAVRHTLRTNVFPGGYCSQGCGRMSPCPSGASCRGGGGNNFCLDECTQPTDCRPGYNCIQLGVSMGSRVCWPVPPTSTNPMGAAVGSGCAQDDECAAGLTCLSEQGFPGGYCTALYCDPVTNPCPANSGCYAFPGLFSLCLAECPSGGMRSTCRPQYYCLGPSGQPGVCIGN
jgi:hypothetical protein